MAPDTRDPLYQAMRSAAIRALPVLVLAPVVLLVPDSLAPVKLAAAVAAAVYLAFIVARLYISILATLRARRLHRP